MLRYRSRRYFEYVMLKTPILSIFILAATLFVAYSVSENTYVDTYMEAAAELSDGYVSARIDSTVEYEKDHPYGYVRISDDSSRYRVIYHSLKESDGHLMLFYCFQSGQVPEEIKAAGDITLEIVKERITLTRRILSSLVE